MISPTTEEENDFSGELTVDCALTTPDEKTALPVKDFSSAETEKGKDVKIYMFLNFQKSYNQLTTTNSIS